MDRQTLLMSWRMVVASWKTFGFRHACFSAGYLPLMAFSQLLLQLDRVFFPRFRRAAIRRPVFILGHPRSGTTFLHRLVTQTDEFACFRAWELFIPSLTGRVLLRPLLAGGTRLLGPRLYRNGQLYPSGSHSVSRESTEEEEFLFMHWADTAFLNKAPLAFDDRDNQELVCYDNQPARHRQRSMRRFRGCLQRQVLWTGKDRIVAKMPYSTMRIKTLLQEFPDARIIYLLRSPIETIRSHLTQHREYFDSRWGLERIPPEKLKRYYRRRYEANVALYRYFHELWHAGELPRDQVWVLPYDRLLKDLAGTFEQFVRFTGIEASDELWAKVREQAARQKDYRAGHRKLELEEFGLSEEEIRRDLSFIFDELGETNPGNPPPPAALTRPEPRVTRHAAVTARR